MACFARHVEAGIVGRQALGLVLLDRPLDRPFTPVVRGEGKVPVTVHVVDGLQVIERGAGRGDNVTALVLPPVLLEVEALAGGRDELPQAGSMGARIGHRVEGAFDHRQQRDLGRHAARFDFLDDVMQVGAAALDHAAQRVWTVLVPLLVVQGQAVVEVGHCEAVTDAVPEVVTRGGQVDAARNDRRSNDLDGGEALAGRPRRGRCEQRSTERLVAIRRLGRRDCQCGEHERSDAGQRGNELAMVHGGESPGSRP